MLARRLQSMVFKKGMALSPLHARQLIVHGHVAVGERIITVPGYAVGGQEEGMIKLMGGAQPKEGPPAEEAAKPEVKVEAPAVEPAEAK